MYEHLKASGLHSAAAALAKEAGLASSRPHSTASQHQQHAAAPGAAGLAGSMSPAAAGLAAASTATLDGQPVGASAFASAAAAGPATVFGKGSSSGIELSGKERRKTLSLGPGLLSQLNKETTPEADDKQQQQQRMAASSKAGVPAVAAGTSTASAAGSGGSGSAGQGLMSPPPPVSGAKRKVAAAAATPSSSAAAGGSNSTEAFQTPAGKRQAVGATPSAATPAAVEAADGTDAAAGVLPLSPVPVACTPVPSSSKRPGSSRAAGKTPAAAVAGSDAEYLQTLHTQQQQQQQQQQELFHTQSLPATPSMQGPGGSKPGVSVVPHRSPHTAANPAHGTAGFSSTPSPGSFVGFGALETPGPSSFGGFRDGSAAAAGYSGGQTPAPPAMPSPGGSSQHPSNLGPSPAAAPAAAEACKETGVVRVNPLLTNLPSRQLGKSAGGLQRRLSGGVDLPHRMTPIAEAVTEPKPLPLHVQIAARDVMTGPPVNSRLGGIVTAYLKQQHRSACLASAQPVSVVPPVSLLKPYTLPSATRPLQAPGHVTLRRGRQELFGGFGGRGGSSATRRFVWSRFRLTQTLRDDGPLLTACTFLRGFDLLVSGTSNGELKLHDAYTGDNIELIDAHTAAVNLLQASPWLGGTPGDQLLLSSSRSEVLLWRADGFDTGPLFTWNGLTRGRFNPAASQVVGVAVGSSPRQARVYDVNTGEVISTLDEAAAAAAAGTGAAAAAGAGAAGGGAGGEYVRGAASACFSPSGELVLWGATLWDPRVPAPLHTFDQLSAGGAGGCFHPGGAEIILNSEVWDLRNRKLLRSVPTLDGTSIIFNSSGDVLCAWLRRPADDSMAALLQPKRRRHALATSFISMDARSYTEIGSVQVERAVLDLCLDPSDSYLAAVAVDIGGGLEGSVSSSVRLYEVGRQRPAAGDEDDESDGAGEESEEEEEEDDNDDLVNGGGLQALLGADADADGDMIAGGSEDDEGAEEGEDLDLEDGMTLEDALADMYEEAIAAGVDPDELDIDLSGEEEDYEGDDEDDLLDALGEESSEYETDEEAG